MQKLLTQKYYADKRKHTTHRTKALIALAWVSILWGTTWLAAKEGVRNMPALQMVSIRQILAGTLYLIFFLIKKQALPKGKQWIPILILSVLNFMLSNALSTWGVKYISSGLGSIIGAIFPLWILIISLVGGKQIPRKALIGLLMGFGGICIIFYEHLKDFINSNFTIGIILSVASTIAWAFGTLYTKQQAIHFNPYFSLGFQMFISGIALSFIAYTTNNIISITEIPSASWWAIGYLVIFGSIITFAAYLYALQHLPTALTSVYAYINPIIAVILGSVILDEKFSLFIAAGGAITLAGLYLVNNSFKIKGKTDIEEPRN